MPLYHYRTRDGVLHEVTMTITEWGRREKNGRLRLPGGKVGIREYHRTVGSSRNVDRSSTALQVLNEDCNEVIKEDRRINPNSAPNHYDREGKPHWKGDAVAVRQRIRQYCRERGLAKYE